MRQQESRLELEQQAGLLTEYEAKQKLLTLHQQTAQTIAGLIPTMRELSAATGDQQTLENLEQMQLKLTTVKDTAIVSAQPINQSFAGGITNALSDFVSGAKSAKDAFAQFAADFFKTNRKITPIAFTGAPRMHSGGIAGLRPDEVPSILQRGEEVLTSQAPRHRLNNPTTGMSTNATPNNTSVKIVNVIDPSVVHDYLSSSQGERVILNVLQKNPRIVQQVVS